MTEPSGYKLETLWEDVEFVLSRGGRDGETSRLLVVAPASAQPSPRSLAWLEHAFALRDELDSAWAARPFLLMRERGRPTLLLEDPGGEPLARLMGQPWEITSFLRVAIGLATALGRLHERGLIHKDVKPAHVLINAATSAVWLTGFGIASRLPREHQAPEPPEVIAGTLAYMAPEQTGRMNRSVDSRSDLYALGVTFYEMLTGVLPFAAADPMEWVHCHIARQPPPPGERADGTPGPLSAIVIKLLAKTAEDRYQTALGVAADLRRCQAEWEAHGGIAPFPLGAQDVPDRLLIPETLYGREREIDTLLAAFDRVVAQGTPELVLVSGYSGIGKSSVVNELHKVLVPPRGLFASGKFDQYKRDIPYATLAQAFQSLVRPLLGRSEAELGRWRDALREALGPNSQLIVDLVPELELVIGTPSPVPDLPPKDAQNRFQLAFRRLLGVFARPEHPLTLFLDDLQWLDAATLDLLEHLATHPEVRHLLLVGAYRDNEVGPGHPLLRTLEAIREAGARVEAIVLTPLELEDVSGLVSDALHCELERARPLAQLVQEKTGGNPFFAIQFFAALAEDGLLAFDSVTRAWQWDVDRIRAKSYTDNVVDLLSAKLSRLSASAREALKHLACLGNAAEVATLALVQGETEEAMHAALWEAARAGLVFDQESTCRFLHDRIQQAAYSLIPDEHRANMHLRIGRVLLARMSKDQLAEHLFDVANQFNRGAVLLVDRNEKADIATLNLRTGRKAKASAAYASARTYFASGITLLDERDWGIQHELIFSLSLEFAECELLRGGMEKAAQLIVELLQRAASDVEFADASCLKINLHVLTGEHSLAIDSALTCLRRFGIHLPAHPTPEQVRAEYETVWQTLDGHTIESLIDLPPMTDPKIQAAMQVLSVLAGPATFTDFQLSCLLACRMVNISIQHGMSGASAYAYACLGSILGPNFHRYREGYRLGRLACDLVAKHSFTAYDTKVSHAMGLAAFWTQPLTSVIELRRATTRTATERGDLTFACYGMHQSITYLLMRNDPLDAVWRESAMALDFARTAKFRDVVDLIVSQQRFIASMQGRDATFSAFSDERFDEAAFEVQLTAARMPTMICLHWIRKLKARYLSGDYAEALLASDKAKALLLISSVHLQLFDYSYYTALTAAALYDEAPADQQTEWRERLSAHQEQLREWAETYPPTFADKHALVSAEIARLEGRDADAMRLYEEAIRSAHDHGFVQNEGTAHEVAARFYSARGFETITQAYLRNARYCYLRWGALGKVRQLEQSHPQLREDSAPSPATALFGAPNEQLDLSAMVKASQAVSGEIVLDRLIEILMTLALEQAGAERGLLILLRGDTPQIEAVARTGRKTVGVTLRPETVTPAELPESLLHTVIRTRESVILDDASAQNSFSADEYIRRTRARSVLGLPLVKQAELIGVLYLENNLTPHVFTPARLAVLKLLASQAAISLENARLYGDLEEREAKIRRLVDANIIGIFIWSLHGEILEANEAFLHTVGYDREDLASGRLRWTELTPAEWLDRDRQQFVPELKTNGSLHPFEKEFLRKDGSRVPVLIGVATFGTESDQGVAFVLDLTERKRADEERARMLRAEAANRAKDEFLANVSHEIRTPMNAILGMTELALDTPLAEDQRQYLKTVKSAADNLLGMINDLLDFSKIEAGKLALDVADFSLRATVGDTLRALAVRAHSKGLELIYDAQPALPEALVGDAGRLRQVLLNLVGNAIKFTEAGEVVVRVELADEGAPEGEAGLRFTVRDTGIGIPRDQQERIFRAFEQEDPSTTRRYGGTGLGLTIAARLAALMGGAITVQSEPGRGSTFAFTARFGRRPHPAEPVAGRTRIMLRGLQVLVVDDNPTNRQILEQWLRDWQMDSTAVGDGLAAIGALWDAASIGRPFPLVLLDARMPDTDGLTVAGWIRERAALSTIRIILLTSGDRPGDPARSRELRIDAHLLKPVLQDELLETIYRVMGRAKGDAGATVEEPAREPAPVPVPAPAPLHILVAEDNAFNSLLLEQLVTRRGHRVRLATNGREALALAGEGGFDLLLLDVHMPELDGFEVVQAIRERERSMGGHLPVIALTARARHEDRDRCLAAGMDDFLTKPIGPAEVFAAIERVLSGRPASEPPPTPSTESAVLVDPKMLLAACDDDPVLLDKLIRIFQNNLPGSLARVQEAIARQDPAQLRESAHQLRGLLSTFSPEAAQAAALLEAMGAGGELGEAASRFENLADLIERLGKLLENLPIDELRRRAKRAQEMQAPS